MIRARRRAHLRTWLVLAPVLGLLIAGALALRQHAPAATPDAQRLAAP
jgi:hypothetical protein